jgi:TonB-linked SusC/RagA family outer membrane protein
MRHVRCLGRGFGFALVLSFLGLSSAAAQTRNVTGHVTEDGSGLPVPAAQVLVKGTSIGTVAEDDGAFTLRVPDGEVVLQVRRIGYQRIEVSVPATQSSVEIKIRKDVLQLDQMVVTGQATGIEKRNLANAVAVVNADELNKVQSQSFESALQGKVAGANISANNGAPGGGLQIQLRGTTSIIGNSEPLYVIDGIVASNAAIAGGANALTGARGGDISSTQDNASNRLADLNPNDIESIEILKGASASAIYGSKASNGVVIITTKRGKAGESSLSFTQRIGFSRVSNRLGMRRFDSEADAVAAYGAAAADYWQPGAFYDHEKELTDGSALSNQTSISLRGGTDKTRYFASGLYESDDGVVTNTGFDKQSVRLNLDQTLGSRLKLSINSNVAHTNTRRGLTNNDNRGVSYWVALTGEPSCLDLRQQADGSFPVTPFARSNTNQTAALVTNESVVWHMLGSATATFDAITADHHKLVLTAIGGSDFFQQRDDVFSPPILQYEQSTATPGTSVAANSNSLNLNFNANAVYTYTPSNAWSLTTSLGGSRESRELTTERARSRNQIGGLQNIDRGTVLDADQNRARVEDETLFLQEEFKLHDLYLVAGLTADKSSANADVEEFNVYPKFSGSYRFNVGNHILDAVKIRGSVGASGNLPLYGQKFTELVGTNVDGLPSTTLEGTTARNDIRPEKEREIEGGLDLYLFGNRATIGATAYEKRITDLLQRRQLPQSSGYDDEIFNGGVMRTRGVELELTAVPLAKEKVQWTAGATFSLSRAKVLGLPVPPYFSGGFGGLGQPRIAEGESPTQLVGPDTLPDGSSTIAKLGDINPDFLAGFTNDIQYGRARLYFLFDWRHGGDIVNLTHWLYDLSAASPDFGDVITVGGEQVQAGQYRLDSYQKTKRVYIEDGSFVKLREVTFSYELDPKLIQSVWSGVQSLNLSVSGRNLLTWTGYSGLDPEVSNFGNQQLARSIDVAPYPPSRSFWFAINVGF